MDDRAFAKLEFHFKEGTTLLARDGLRWEGVKIVNVADNVVIVKTHAMQNCGIF